jgi:hypothetical protein
MTDLEFSLLLGPKPLNSYSINLNLNQFLLILVKNKFNFK